MDVSLKTVWSDDAVPYQLMYALPGNIESLGQDFTFRTLDFAEVFGDQVVSIGMQYNFKDVLFNKLNIPVLEDLQLLLSAHLNAAWLTISDKTKALNKYLIPSNTIEFKSPFVEMGFSLGQMLLPLRFEFTWRLNNTNRNEFVFGINSVAF